MRITPEALANELAEMRHALHTMHERLHTLSQETEIETSEFIDTAYWSLGEAIDDLGDAITDTIENNIKPDETNQVLINTMIDELLAYKNEEIN